MLLTCLIIQEIPQGRIKIQKEKCTRKNRTQVDHGKGKMGGVENFLRANFVRSKCIMIQGHLLISLIKDKKRVSNCRYIEREIVDFTCLWARLMLIERSQPPVWICNQPLPRQRSQQLYHYPALLRKFLRMQSPNCCPTQQENFSYTPLKFIEIVIIPIVFYIILRPS